jgi:5-methylcytosine-specific restriction endonuclease McrA
MTGSPLCRDTLVLNRGWLAIASTPVRNALRLLYSEAALVVQPDTFEVHDFESWSRLEVPEGEQSISTVRLKLCIPEVIVLNSFSGIPRQSLPFTRKNLIRRDHSTCQYCGKQPGQAQLSVDHVIPRSKGGETSWANCVLACLRCNHRKGNKLASEVGMILLQEPKPPAWSPIFEVAGAEKPAAWRRFVGEQNWVEAS